MHIELSYMQMGSILTIEYKYINKNMKYDTLEK